MIREGITQPIDFYTIRFIFATRGLKQIKGHFNIFQKASCTIIAIVSMVKLRGTGNPPKFNTEASGHRRLAAHSYIPQRGGFNHPTCINAYTPSHTRPRQTLSSHRSICDQQSAPALLTREVPAGTDRRPRQLLPAAPANIQDSLTSDSHVRITPANESEALAWTGNLLIWCLRL